MADKPDFYTFAEVVEHLAGHRPRERIELDILQGVLPAGAAVGFTSVRGEAAKHRHRLICLDSSAARAVLREGRCSLASALYPVFIDSNGPTERYALEHAAFTRPVTIEAADLLLFSFQLWPYIVHAGRKRSEPERQPLEPILGEVRDLLIGEHYDMRDILEREDLTKRVAELMNKSLERARSRAPVRIWPTPADSERGHGDAPPRRVSAEAAQDTAIADALRKLGHDPDNVPPHDKPGKPGLRSDVKALVMPDGPNGTFTEHTFQKAWQRLCDRQKPGNRGR